MATKRVNITLDFKANTQQAKQQLNALQTSLDQITRNQAINVNQTGITQAAQAAQNLQRHLQAATDVNTGKLDLSKFSASLASANQNLSTLGANLLTAGNDGQQAFVALAASIARAQQPVLTLSSSLSKLTTSFANTIRWQISSSVLNAFIGSVQKAWGYVKDLNKSLTDIRIVTGYSADNMAKFAKEANKAARELSTTTNEYAKASLIYYQQGLSVAEVEKRTNVTIKMANASGQTAQVVSDQMTAIWNNFYDGSKSLEYYADVVTKLGAATASSSEEIATGLEKFAAIAESTGLSYEYATAALATVTSQTRQSADVVGTAFKTLFARIQDLELGETLEDGVTLG